MMQLLLPLVIIIASVLGFFKVTEPVLGRIDELRAEKRVLNTALDNAKKLRAEQDRLLETYRTIPAADLQNLNKFLPDNVDNVRLIIDIDNIAERHAMSIKNIRIKTEEGKTEDSVIEGAANQKGAVTLGFSVTGSYTNFQSFVADLAKSLRLVDIAATAFASGERNVYDYNVEIQTYWLK